MNIYDYKGKKAKIIWTFPETGDEVLYATINWMENPLISVSCLADGSEQLINMAHWGFGSIVIYEEDETGKE